MVKLHQEQSYIRNLKFLMQYNFSVWSKSPIETAKQDEEERIKLLDACTVSQANKEVIRREVKALWNLLFDEYNTSLQDSKLL